MPAHSRKNTRRTSADNLTIPVLTWIISLIALIALAIIIVVNLGEEKHILTLLSQAKPWWLIAGVGLQIATYICAGAMWYQVFVSAGHRPPFTSLVILSVEMLSINQIVPVVGMAGNIVLIRTIRRMGMPYALAMDALLVEILAKFASFAVVGPLTLLVLFLYHDITAVVVWLVVIFSLVAVSVSLGILWLLDHRVWRPPSWLGRWKMVKGLIETIEHISPERVRSPMLITKTAALYTAIFFLDAATLYVMLQAIGLSVNPVTPFVALIIASMASNVSILPSGDLGSFEVACAGTLSLMGVPVAAALAGTLLLRSLTYWLPLIPGLLLAHYEMRRALPARKP